MSRHLYLLLTMRLIVLCLSSTYIQSHCEYTLIELTVAACCTGRLSYSGWQSSQELQHAHRHTGQAISKSITEMLARIYISLAPGRHLDGAHSKRQKRRTQCRECRPEQNSWSVHSRWTDQRSRDGRSKPNEKHVCLELCHATDHLGAALYGTELFRST